MAYSSHIFLDKIATAPHYPLQQEANQQWRKALIQPISIPDLSHIIGVKSAFSNNEKAITRPDGSVDPNLRKHILQTVTSLDAPPIFDRLDMSRRDVIKRETKMKKLYTKTFSPTKQERVMATSTTNVSMMTAGSRKGSSSSMSAVVSAAQFRKASIDNGTYVSEQYSQQSDDYSQQSEYSRRADSAASSKSGRIVPKKSKKGTKKGKKVVGNRAGGGGRGGGGSAASSEQYSEDEFAS
jgi:hypothetical protein